MKSIIFAALIAYASATSLFDDVQSDEIELGSSSGEAISTSDVTVAPVLDATQESGFVGEDEGVNTDMSDSLIQTDDYVAETADWETETKINTTDYYDNAATKAEMKDFEWDSFDMSEFTFTDLLNLLNNDAQVAELKDQVQTNYVNWYTQEAEKLPEVCDAGRQCRAEIKAEATQYISVEWQNTMASIKSVITSTINDSRVLLQEAYKAAFYCEGGCTCEFVETRFAHLVASYKEVETSIEWYQREIDVRLGYFGELDRDCPHFDEKDERDALNAEHAAEIEGIKDWLDDGFELEEVVDQQAFEAKYGFRYESSEFDRYFEGKDRSEDYNQATETTFDF
jgi:hypothetical protein